MPGVFDYYAARSAWSAQQNLNLGSSAREGNLDKPMDDEPEGDRGARGRFGDRAHGVLDRHFLRSLGQVARDVAASVHDRARELGSQAAG